MPLSWSLLSLHHSCGMRSLFGNCDEHTDLMEHAQYEDALMVFQQTAAQSRETFGENSREHLTDRIHVCR